MATTFEEILESDGQLMYRTKGTSMWPLLREGVDLVVVDRKGDKRLSFLDVPLYRRDCGKYILHRVMWVRRNDYVICGDNQYYLERGIQDRHILGVMTAVIRGGKRIECSSMRMRLYSLLQWLLYPAKAVWMVCRRVVWPRLKSKFSGKNA